MVDCWKNHPFYLWCEKYIPIYWNAGLSFDENIGRLTCVVNELIKFDKEMLEAYQNVINEFNSLKNWVENYFKNLDVQEEINNKIDDMIKDGTFGEIVGDRLNYKIDKSKQTIYVFESMDITPIVQALNDNETLILQKGTYALTTSILQKNNITIKGENGTQILSSDNTPLKIIGNNITIRDIDFVNNNTNKYPESSVPIFGFIEIVGNNFIIDNCTFNNISKSFLYTQGYGTISNSKFLGNMSGSEYPVVSANNNLFGLYLANVSGSPQTTPYNVYNCFFSDLIEGVYFGDYNFGISTESAVINNCRFTNNYDHGVYINGGDNAYISNCHFISCNAPIATYGNTVSIIGNTQEGTLVNQYNYYQGILSIRSPQKCIISDNIFKASSIEGSVFINITNLHNGTIGDIEICNNIIETSGKSDIIRIGHATYTTNINNVIISDNIIKGESKNSVIPINSSIDTLIFNNNTLIISNPLIVISPYKPIANGIFTNNIYVYNGEQPLNNVNVALLNSEISNGVMANNQMVTKTNVTAYLYIGSSALTLYGNIINNGASTTSQNCLVVMNKLNNENSFGELTVSGVGPTTLKNSSINGNSHVLLFATDNAGAAILKDGYFYTYGSPGNCTITFTTPTSGTKLKYLIM